MSKYFCCCIPVRFGVFVIALLSFLGSSLLAASVWYSIARPGQLKNVNLTGQLKIAFIVVGSFASVVAVASFLGLMSAIFRIRGLVAFYAGFLWVALIANVGIGAYYIYQLVRHFHSGVNVCENTLNNGFTGNTTTANTPSANNACISGTAAKIVYIGVFVAELLVMLFGTIIVHRYKHQLEEEEWNRPGRFLYAAPVPVAHPLGSTNFAYNNSAQLGAYQPVSHSGPEVYPYSAAEHSYGNRV